MDLTIKDIHIIINQFREFVESVIKSAKELMYDVFMFDLDPPNIDLSSLRDYMTKEEVGFSLMK